MASEFLENLKRARETGITNPDLVNHLNEVDNLAKSKSYSGRDTNEEVNRIKGEYRKMVDDGTIKKPTEDEMKASIEANNAQEMELLEEKKLLSKISGLLNLEDKIRHGIYDLLNHAEILEKKYDKNNLNYKQLYDEIEIIRDKYSDFMEDREIIKYNEEENNY